MVIQLMRLRVPFKYPWRNKVNHTVSKSARRRRWISEAKAWGNFAHAKPDDDDLRCNEQSQSDCKSDSKEKETMLI